MHFDVVTSPYFILPCLPTSAFASALFLSVAAQSSSSAPSTERHAMQRGMRAPSPFPGLSFRFIGVGPNG